VTESPLRCIVCGVDASEGFDAGGVALRRCGDCGLAWRRDFPDAADLSALYGDDYFERWGIDAPERLAEVRAMKEATYRTFFDEIRRHRADGRLLDLGCALGFLLGVAREAGFDAHGLDLNESAIAEARSRFGDRVHAGELDAAAFPGRKFDVVTLIDVFEHVPDPDSLLATIAARVAPGGIVAAVLPDAHSRVARLLGRRWPHYNAEHLFYWSAANLRRFLEARSWRVCALRRGLRKTFTARYLDHYARHLGRPLVPGLGLFGSLRLRIPTGEMLVIASPPEGAG
jgi:SAM-dependent methyltransferase